jgi:hypothetical protein
LRSPKVDDCIKRAMLRGPDSSSGKSKSQIASRC